MRSSSDGWVALKAKSYISEVSPRWKLFTFSLVDRAEQWYTRMIGSVDTWEELRDDFCYSFSPFQRSDLLLCEFCEFGQLEGEFIGVAWAWFSHLLEFSSDFSIPDELSLCIFYVSSDIKSTQELTNPRVLNWSHLSLNHMDDRKNDLPLMNVFWRDLMR
jgi:hypothetical protein